MLISLAFVKTLRAAYPLIIGLLLSGCALYVPTVPSTPLVRQGQLEAGANLRAFSSLEATAAYSPLNHVLVAVETSYRQSDWSQTTAGVTTAGVDRHQQLTLGVGTYRTTDGPYPLYIAGVIGAGYATATTHDFDFLFPLPQSATTYQAQYMRYYGQLYLAQTQRERLTTGGSVRATCVQYGALQQNSVTFYNPGTRFFLEPTFFGRLGGGVIQVQGTVGLSMPLNPLNKDKEPASVLTPTSLLLSAGIIFRPYQLRARKAKAATYYN